MLVKRQSSLLVPAVCRLQAETAPKILKNQTIAHAATSMRRKLCADYAQKQSAVDAQMKQK